MPREPPKSLWQFMDPELEGVGRVEALSPVGSPCRGTELDPPLIKEMQALQASLEGLEPWSAIPLRSYNSLAVTKHARNTAPLRPPQGMFQVHRIFHQVGTLSLLDQA